MTALLLTPTFAAIHVVGVLGIIAVVVGVAVVICGLLNLFDYEAFYGFVLLAVGLVILGLGVYGILYGDYLNRVA